MAGTLRAEATLAAANLVFLLLLVGGGVIVPLDKFPGGVRPCSTCCRSAALSDGLRDVLQHGAAMPWGDLGILAAWACRRLGGRREGLQVGVAGKRWLRTMTETVSAGTVSHD